MVRAVMEALSEFADTRTAEAGEFTRRAFLNGKLDLVETEALADLIAAETETQRRLALESAGGAQSDLYAAWRSRIVHAIAMIEAELDFADEGDVPGSVADLIWTDLTVLIGEIERHAGSFHQAEIIRDGFRVVLLGAPNSGKSSLLNALARRDVAIVTEEAGTTRDLIDVALDLGGMKVIVTDTAGIRSDPGRVEALGIERALKRAREADLVISLTAADSPSAATPMVAGAFRVLSKADLAATDDLGDCGLAVSSTTGEGLDKLLDEISARARSATTNAGLLPGRLRHVELLLRAVSSLRAACDLDAEWLELRAEELRNAAKAFGAIAGRIDVEDVLDRVFSEFCIGK